MSIPEPTRQSEVTPEHLRDPPPARGIGGCLPVLGIVLTLPGICTVFAVGWPAWWFFALLTFPLAALGLAVTLRALNAKARDPEPPDGK